MIMVKQSPPQKTRAPAEKSGTWQEVPSNAPGCADLQFLPTIGVYPGTGILPLGSTKFGSDGVLYMASFNNLLMSAVRGPDEQDFSVQLPIQLFGVSSVELSPGNPRKVTSVQTDIALSGQIVMTQTNDGTLYTLSVVICPVGIA